MHNRKAGDALAWPCCSRPAAKYVEPDRFGKKQSTGPGSPKKSNTIARNASRGHFLSESFVPSKWYDCPSSLRKSLCEKQQLVPLWFLQYPCKGNMTARPSALKRRTFGKIRQASQPPPPVDHHNVYVVLLAPPGGKNRKVLPANPPRNSKKPGCLCRPAGPNPQRAFPHHKQG